MQGMGLDGYSATDLKRCWPQRDKKKLPEYIHMYLMRLIFLAAVGHRCVKYLSSRQSLQCTYAYTYTDEYLSKITRWNEPISIMRIIVRWCIRSSFTLDYCWCKRKSFEIFASCFRSIEPKTKTNKYPARSVSNTRFHIFKCTTHHTHTQHAISFCILISFDLNRFTRILLLFWIKISESHHFEMEIFKFLFNKNTF